MHLTTILYILVAMFLIATLHTALTSTYRYDLKMLLVLCGIGLMIFLGTVYYTDIYRDDRRISQWVFPVLIGYAILAPMIRALRKSQHRSDE